jgi:hypothetical protein
MRTVVKEIRRCDVAENFMVTVEADGQEKSFRLSVVSPDFYSVKFDRDFEEVFANSMAPKKIARLVIDAYAGKAQVFPVDLGDI